MHFAPCRGGCILNNQRARIPIKYRTRRLGRATHDRLGCRRQETGSPCLRGPDPPTQGRQRKGSPGSRAAPFDSQTQILCAATALAPRLTHTASAKLRPTVFYLASRTPGPPSLFCFESRKITPASSSARRTAATLAAVLALGPRSLSIRRTVGTDSLETSANFG